MGKVERDVPSRKLVDADNNVIDGTHPLPVEIAGSGDGGYVNTKVHAQNDDNTAATEPLKRDPVSGALIVTGAGAAATATSLRIKDATLDQFAAIDASGQVSVNDAAGNASLDAIEASAASIDGKVATETTAAAILAQLDDATADTVLSVLKSLYNELAQKTEPTDIQNIDGNVTVDNLDFPDSGTHTKLDTLNAKDFATQATLSALETKAATEATLELIRAQTAAINTNTDAIETLLTTLRDNQLRRTDPLAAGANVVGKVQLDQAASHFVSSAGSMKVEQGRFFIGGKAIDLGGLASSDRAVFRLANPTGSTKNLYVMMVTIYSTISQQVRYNEDGTITADGTITPMNLNRAMGAFTPVSVADLTYAKTAITGGTEWPNESRVFNTGPLTLNFSNSPVKLGPGKSLLVRGTSGDAQTFTVNAYWIEEPA